MRRLLLLVFVSGCGVYDSPTYMPPGTSGKTCFTDDDCAPNGCCGMGTAVVHKDEAPSCAGVTCTGSCPPSGIKCGCAVPVCRDSRCVAAVSPTPDC